ncbi:MAG: hypothetical protein E6K54_04220 [Gammaproteobacteria bacterium]|nr:MAG: hypothetical protein E6K54_04220 [Gammaproteobacteria bacterium]
MKIRRVKGISANCCIRNSTSLDLVKKAFYRQKMKDDLETSIKFDKEESSPPEKNQDLNQDNTGKNLTFFLKNLPKIATENEENSTVKSPIPTK